MINRVTKFMAPLALLLSGLAPGRAAPMPSPGLSVRDGVVMEDGHPYRGIGANYFSLFSRLLTHPYDTSSLTQLAALAKAGIPFVRFSCCGFWPDEQRLYLTNRQAFFQRLDRVVHCAETNHIGLIPSLFWNESTVPDLMGEHMDQYGNPDSRTIAFIRRYTEDIVRRYLHSPAIWAWEFGNEYNLACDLPNAGQHRPAVWPQLGTATNRTARDELHFAELKVAFSAFSETIRKYDTTRLVESGNSLPRPAAWHNLHEESWSPDTPAQFAEILRRDNPDPMNAVSVHIYPTSGGRYPGGAKSIADAVGLANRAALQAGKPLFLGEFGVDRKSGSTARQRARFQEFLDAIAQHHVALAAFWVFDLPNQDRDWNVTFNNDRAWMIERVARANAKARQMLK